MDGCLTRELNNSSKDLLGHEKAPHWNSKLVSRVMKLAFSSSSVKLQATGNGQQEEIELNLSLQVIKKYPPSFSNLEACAGYAAWGLLPSSSFSPRAIAS